MKKQQTSRAKSSGIGMLLASAAVAATVGCWAALSNPAEATQVAANPSVDPSVALLPTTAPVATLVPVVSQPAAAAQPTAQADVPEVTLPTAVASAQSTMPAPRARTRSSR
ncbi:hypothetical protein F8S13_01665 [Chloroflexia bacterium SDU3-3]|nr:hypothetical protein F8S13_01665 [Chloroflexia bacterium SDU3-3]